MHQRANGPLVVVAILICGPLCFFANRLTPPKQVNLIQKPRMSIELTALPPIHNPSISQTRGDSTASAPRVELASDDSQSPQIQSDIFPTADPAVPAVVGTELTSAGSSPLTASDESTLQPPATISLAHTSDESHVALTRFGSDPNGDNTGEFLIEFDQEVDTEASAGMKMEGPLKTGEVLEDSASEAVEQFGSAQTTDVGTSDFAGIKKPADQSEGEMETPGSPVESASSAEAANPTAKNETDFDFGSTPNEQGEAAGDADLSEVNAELSATGWPEFQLLFDELDGLEANSQVQPLVVTVRSALESLQREIPIGDQRADRYLEQLATASQSLHDLARELWLRAGDPDDPEAKRLTSIASQLSRFTYRLDRRWRLWKRVNQQAGNPDAIPVSEPLRSVSNRKINLDDFDRSWAEYLFLDEWVACFNSLVPDEIDSLKAARRTLARLYSSALNSQQSAYVRSLIAPQLLAEIKQAAGRPVDYTKLLAAIERFESEPNSISAYVLNDHYQNLLWSNVAGNHSIAAELEAHYRNANFRVSVSQAMLNRLVPELPDTAEPFTDRLMGASIRGHNSISNQLQVELVPDPDQLHLQLGTLGQVDSDSVAKRDGFTIRSKSQAEFQVYKKILIDRNGINASAQPVAHSTIDQRVTGVESKLDPIPVLGVVARRLAERKIRSQKPQSDRIVRKRVANSASERVHDLVNAEVEKMSKYIYDNLLQPLTAMDLEPQPVQLATTSDQLIVRYRLAGRDQMAAHSARPSDDKNSLLNIQIHQSALNNVIARLELSDNQFTTQQLIDHLNGLLGLTLTPDQDAPEAEAEFEFSRFDPLQVEFQDDRILLTMNLDSLRIGDGKRWQKVTLTACYRAHCDGTQIHLTQDDEGKRIKGYRLRFRDRASIGTVHQVLFKRDYQFDVLPKQIGDKLGVETLELSQLVLFDGWVGMSLAELPGRSILAGNPVPTPVGQAEKSKRLAR